MKFELIFILFCSLQATQSHLFPYGPRSPLQGTPAPVGSIWPLPVTRESSTNVFTVDTETFKTELVQQGSNLPINCPTLDFAREHYTQAIQNLNKRTHPKTPKPLDGVSTLQIQLLECTPNFTPDALEYYDLTITPDPNSGEAVVTLKADVPLGVIRGLETFFQLIWQTESREGASPYYVNETSIKDWARFSHRGMMIDTARHYLPESKIFEILTTMMYNKFNVFHWHIVDDQSYPYVSLKFPELSEEGMYNSEAYYTPEAVQRVIEGARVRGIRVIFEFDTPGHAGGIGKSHPELLTPCYGDGVHPGTPNFPEHAEYENLDPTNEKVYTFMRELFKEIVDNVTKDDFVHLGMDEVYDPCYRSSPLIKAFMLDNGYTEYSQVQGHYTQKHIAMAKSLNPKINLISWQDPMDDGVELDTDVILQIWKHWVENTWPDSFQKALNKGHRVILSACWYVNYINYGESWRDYYNCDPILGANVTEAQRDQVLGGEACIWGEFVDQTNIVPRLFPFASAVAEVLWTEREEIGSTDDAMWRLDQFRCSLLRRGIPAQPILNGHCGSFEVDILQ